MQSYKYCLNPKTSMTLSLSNITLALVVRTCISTFSCMYKFDDCTTYKLITRTYT